MKDVMRFFQVGILLAILFCVLLAKAHDVPTWKIVATSAGITYAAYKLTRRTKSKFASETHLDRYHYITAYHNGFISIEELDAALTKCEIAEAKAAAEVAATNAKAEKDLAKKRKWWFN